MSRFNPAVMALSYLEQWAYRVSDLVVGTMPNLAAHVAKLSSCDARNVICVPMGFSVSPASATGRRRKTNATVMQKSELRVGYAGTIGISNALGVLFESAVTLEAEGAAVTFEIVGDGALLPYYRERYEHLSNITFIGRVSKEEVGSYIENFDVALFSTFNSRVWDYGQSLNKIIDYMVLGVPVLGCYSGFQSMVNEAGCGWFVEAENTDALTNQLRALTKMPREELEDIGLSGQAWIKKYRQYSDLAREFHDALSKIR